MRHPWDKLDIDGLPSRHAESEALVENLEATTASLSNLVVRAEPSLHRGFVKCKAPTKHKALREVRTLAEGAPQSASDPGDPIDFVLHPHSVLEGRSVAYVLAVSARELGDPIAQLILTEARDRSIHSLRVRPTSAFRRPPLDVEKRLHAGALRAPAAPPASSRQWP